MFIMKFAGRLVSACVATYVANSCRPGQKLWLTVTESWANGREARDSVDCTDCTLTFWLVQYIRVQYSAVQYSTMHYSEARYSRMHCSAVQYSTVQCGAVQYSARQPVRV